MGMSIFSVDIIQRDLALSISAIINFSIIVSQALKQEVQDRKPAMDRLNKTGAALAALCDPAGASEVNAMLDDDNRRMDEVRTRVRDRSNSIDLAMQQSAEVGALWREAAD